MQEELVGTGQPKKTLPPPVKPIPGQHQRAADVEFGKAVVKPPEPPKPPEKPIEQMAPHRVVRDQMLTIDFQTRKFKQNDIITDQNLIKQLLHMGVDIVPVVDSGVFVTCPQCKHAFTPKK